MSKKMKMTNAGNTLRLDALGGTPIQFTRLVLGDGKLTTQEPASLTQVIHEVYSIPITEDRCRVVDGHFEFAGPFDRTQLTAAFRWRELALYAMNPESGEEIAFAYGNDYDEGEYVTPDTTGTYVEEEIHVSAFVGESTVQCAYDESVVWVTKKQLEDWQEAQNELYTDTLHKALNEGLARRAGQVVSGPAELINELEPGGVLLVTDDQDPVAVAVTVEALVDEAYKESQSKASELGDILTAELLLALNLRKDRRGSYYAPADVDAVAAELTSCAAMAVSLGYVGSSGAPELSWDQVQGYLVTGLLLSADDAAAEIWPWAKSLDVTTADLLETTQLQQTIDQLQDAMDAAADDINDVVYGEEG